MVALLPARPSKRTEYHSIHHRCSWPILYSHRGCQVEDSTFQCSSTVHPATQPTRPMPRGPARKRQRVESSSVELEEVLPSRPTRGAAGRRPVTRGAGVSYEEEEEYTSSATSTSTGRSRSPSVELVESHPRPQGGWKGKGRAEERGGGDADPDEEVGDGDEEEQEGQETQPADPELEEKQRVWDLFAEEYHDSGFIRVFFTAAETWSCYTGTSRWTDLDRVPSCLHVGVRKHHRRRHHQHPSMLWETSIHHMREQSSSSCPWSSSATRSSCSSGTSR